jgi:predicted transposase YbfD/YdcC
LLRGLFPPELKTHQDVDFVSGRIETRTITVCSAKLKNENFKGIQQIFIIHRARENKKTGKVTEETVYGGHTQGENEKSPEEILQETRSHWSIENREHYVRDVTFNEDKSKIRTGNGAHMMAILRNISINLMRSRGVENMRSQIKYFSSRPENLLDFLGIHRSNLPLSRNCRVPQLNCARQ